MAVLRRLVIEKMWIKSRCPIWRTTVNLIRCKALDCTICRLNENTVVVLRHAVVELRSFGSLNHKNVAKNRFRTYERKRTYRPVTHITDNLNINIHQNNLSAYTEISHRMIAVDAHKEIIRQFYLTKSTARTQENYTRAQIEEHAHTQPQTLMYPNQHN